jgi:hypothetical protein
MFKLWKDYQGVMSFPFSETKLPTQSWVYFLMEHISAIAIAACILIQDNTPRWLIQWFILILLIDLFHYLLFFRDDGIGFNLIKVIVFGLPLLYLEIKRIWTHYNS